MKEQDKEQDTHKFLNQQAVRERVGVFFTWGGDSYTSGKFLNVYPKIEPFVLHGVITPTTPRQSRPDNEYS